LIFDLPADSLSHGQEASQVAFAPPNLSFDQAVVW